MSGRERLVRVCFWIRRTVVSAAVCFIVVYVARGG